jgi:hypothetical protein
MDEEEELDNTLIGQEEEAPAVNTGDALMGAGQPMFTADSNVVATVPGIENIRNPGAFNPASVEPVEPVGPPATIGESIRQTYDESVLANLINKGFGQEAFQSQAPDGTPTFSIFNKRFGTLGSQVPYSEASPEAKAQAMGFMLSTGGVERPLPETPTSPVRTPEQVQSILNEQRATESVQSPTETSQIPAGVSALEATQFPSPDTLALPSEAVGQIPSVNAFSAENAARLNPMMQAQSLEATQGGATAAPPAQTLSQFMRYEDAPEQRTEQFVDEQGRLRRRLTPQASSLQELAPGVQPLAPEYAGFERDSADLQERLRANQRQPGESQADRDSRVAQSRNIGGQTEGLSFEDARRRARGQLAGRNPSASDINSLARAIQAAEPERLAELETKRALDAAELRDAEAKKDFKPQIVEIGDQRLIQLAPEYYQPIRPEPKEDEPFEPRILEHNGFIYFEKKLNEFERQPSTGQTREDILNIIKEEEQKKETMGATPPKETDASDIKSYATEEEALASGEKGEVLIGGRRAVIE